jgi:hypothetical protein
MQEEGEHADSHERLERLREAYETARTDYRVALRVHLEEGHDLVVGRKDPERVHRETHR